MVVLTSDIISEQIRNIIDKTFSIIDIIYIPIFMGIVFIFAIICAIYYHDKCREKESIFVKDYLREIKTEVERF